MASALIMAGGVGERFWPISTARRPKQFVPLTGNRPIIIETFERVKDVVGLNKTFVITTQAQLPLLHEVLKEIPEENIITEPEGRNTGPAIVLGITYIKRKWGIDEAVAVLPSDHFVGDTLKFGETLRRAFGVADLENEIVTLGIKPDRPETEYGYISVGKETDRGVFEGLKFIEKPGYTKAQKYFEKGGYLWNSGIFVFRLATFIRQLEKYAPQLHQGYLAMNRNAEVEDIYHQMPKVSIDYALMEKLPSFLVIPGSFGWDDLGNWRSLESIYPKDEQGNVSVGHSELMDVENCTIFAEDKPAAVIGIKDLVIAVGKEGVLVCSKDRIKEIRQLAGKLNMPQAD